MLTITTAASDMALLTEDERRQAAGVTGAAEDSALLAMDRRISASIMSECNIAAGVGAEPTLWKETLTETFYQVSGQQIILARRHNVVITSVVADSVALDAADYWVDAEAGILTKLSSDIPIYWSASKVVVVYEAGFVTIPGDLKQAAMDFLHSTYLESDRDPLVKSAETDIPGVMREKRDYWVGSIPGQSSEGAVPDIVAGQLKRFRNMAMA